MGILIRFGGRAASALFALLAVAFLALWMQSHWRLQIVETQVGLHAAQLSSVKGHIAIAHLAPRATIGQSYVSVVAGDAADWRKEGAFGFGFYDNGSITALIAPHWFLALSSLSLAAILAFKQRLRFTVRGLLIATTVIAALLGLVVYTV